MLPRRRLASDEPQCRHRSVCPYRRHHSNWIIESPSYRPFGSSSISIYIGALARHHRLSMPLAGLHRDTKPALGAHAPAASGRTHRHSTANIRRRSILVFCRHPKRLGMSVAGFAPRHCRDCYMPARRCAAYSGIHPRLVLWRTRRSYPPERVSRVATSKLAGSSTYPVSRIGFYIHFASVPVFPITLESSSAFSTSKPFTRSSHPAQSVLRCLDESPRSPGRTIIHTIILGDVKGTSKRRACPTLCH
ncbi:hypothetical protein C8J57DRAFT_1535387 [Mycena rebaudengoi]|nr:hypothetical protein C8J57DRAFT_1535387 [Mycena rebaudengoi]